MIWVKLVLTRTKLIFYGLIYRLPSGNLENYLEETDAMVTQIRSWGPCEIKLAGDINVDLSQRNNRVKVYTDGMKQLGLTNIINDTTHIKQMNLGFSLIDHYLMTDVGLHGIAGVIITNASDHFCIYATRKKFTEKHDRSKFKGRAYSKVNRDNFVADIESNDRTEVTNNNDSELAWLNFKEGFLKILFKHAPLKTFTTRDDRQPWICTDYLESANEWDDLRRKAKWTNSACDKILANIARNRTTSLKRQLKRLFFQNSIQDAKGD